MNPQTVKQHVENWLTSVVIDLNLCPFALREYRQNNVRFSISNAETEEGIINDLSIELCRLKECNEFETTLLILPNALQDFLKYNDFLQSADQLVEEMNLDGVLQIASFHPEYQFAETNAGDPENYTNRSPYPILHLLRERSLEYAIEHHRNTEQIPEDNIALMKKLGKRHMASLLAACSPYDE